jgi:hypothetical protein
MSLPRSPWRISNRTLGVCLARNSAACPAELPPPTTATGSPRFHQGRGVVDTSSLELREAWHVELAVAGAGRDQDRPCGYRRPVVERDEVVPVFLLERGRLGRYANSRAELLRLDDRPICQLRARDPGWEAEVVLDPRGGPGLAARRDRVERDRRQALRGPIDGGGEPAGPAPTTRRS